VLQAVEAANERRKRVLVDKVISRFRPHLKGKHFAIWGLAFNLETAVGRARAGHDGPRWQGANHSDAWKSGGQVLKVE